MTDTKKVDKINNWCYADEEEVTELGKTCQSRENNMEVEVCLQRHKSLFPEERDQTQIKICSFFCVVTEKPQTFIGD